MAYDWNGESQKVARAPKSTPKEHALRIVRILHCNRDGQLYLSRSNEPQMMVIYGDEENGECGEMMTLTAKAGWKLAKVLAAAGVNMEEMGSRGLEPKDFADPDFAAAFLMPEGVGLTFRGRVTYRKGNDGEEYPDVTPIRPLLKEDELF